MQKMLLLFIFYSYKDFKTGKRKRVTKGDFKTAKEARKAAQTVLNTLLIGKNIIESNILFRDYSYQWIACCKIGLKLASIYAIELSVKIANQYFGNIQIKNITAYDYQQFLNDYATKASRKTLLSRHFTIKRIFAHALKYNVIRVDPTIDCQPPHAKIEKKDTEALYLNKAELKLFLHYAKYDRVKNEIADQFYVLCVILAYTGIRVGEACALLWNDVDLKQKVISINSSMYSRSTTRYVRQDTPKNGTSIRDVSIGDELVKVIKEWKIHQQERRREYDTQEKREKEDYVLTKINRTKDFESPLTPYYVQAVFRYINQKKIFPKYVHAHMFRHTHASLLADADIPLILIQNRLGHMNDRVTKEIYVHITKSKKNEVAKHFEKYMLI